MAYFALVKANTLHLIPGQRLLKKSDYEVLSESERLLDEAKNQAEEVKNQARAEYAAEKIRGYTEGEKQAKLELSEKMFAMATGTVDYFANIESQVTEIVLASIRRILDSFSDEDLVVMSTRKVLHTISGERHIKMRVSPDIEEKVSGRIVEIMERLPHSSFLEVVSDARLTGSKCVLESELGTVEASVGLQFKALEKSLRKRFQKKQKSAANS